MGWNRQELKEANIGVGGLKKLVKAKRDEKWRKGMMHKRSLERYRMGKERRGGMARMYDNTEGSGLLADARAGMLGTRVTRAKYRAIDTICGLCGKEEETIEHVVVNCDYLGKRQVDLLTAVGLGEGQDWGEIGQTKRRLAIWRRERGDDRLRCS